MRDDEAPLTKAVIDLATEYGRYGYRRVTALLHRQGWHVNHKRVERIWRQQGLNDLPPTTSPVHQLVSTGNHCKTAAVGNTNGSALAMVA